MINKIRKEKYILEFNGKEYPILKIDYHKKQIITADFEEGRFITQKDYIYFNFDKDSPYRLIPVDCLENDNLSPTDDVKILYKLLER